MEIAKIKHVHKGDVVMEGEVLSSTTDIHSLTCEVAEAVYENLSKGERFDVHTIYEDEILYGQPNEDGCCNSLIVTVNLIEGERYSFEVSYNQ